VRFRLEVGRITTSKTMRRSSVFRNNLKNSEVTTKSAVKNPQAIDVGD